MNDTVVVDTVQELLLLARSANLKRQYASIAGSVDPTVACDCTFVGDDVGEISVLGTGLPACDRASGRERVHDSMDETLLAGRYGCAGALVDMSRLSSEKLLCGQEQMFPGVRQGWQEDSSRPTRGRRWTALCNGEKCS